jgi:NAD(P)-dependent dehydrogenase (short-subunit alcohol dehydrogenase family)
LALNHLAYFLLTLELLPLLEAAPDARVVNVSSVAHEHGSIDFADLQLERRYGMWKAYSQSKLANVLFTRELARRLSGSRITANALHPGSVATGFGRNHPGFFGKLVAIGAPFLASPERGARTTLHVATEPGLRGVTGRYFSACRERAPSRAALDDGTALRLWQISEAMTQPTTRLPPS